MTLKTDEQILLYGTSEGTTAVPHAGIRSAATSGHSGPSTILIPLQLELSVGNTLTDDNGQPA